MLQLVSRKYNYKALAHIHMSEISYRTLVANSPKDTGLSLSVQVALRLFYKPHAGLHRQPVAAKQETLLSTSLE